MTDGGLTPPDEKETGRLRTISDSVFAVSLTLLGTSLRVPELGDEVSAARLAEELGRQWHSYAALVASFATVIMWLNHHAIFGLIRASDPPFLVANGFLLLLVTVVPLPTGLVAEYLDTPGRSWR